MLNREGEAMSINGKNIKKILTAAVICAFMAIIVYAITSSVKNAENIFIPSATVIEVWENDEKVNNSNVVTLSNVSGMLTAPKAVEIKNISGNKGQEVFIRVCMFPKFMNTAYDYQIYIPHNDFSQAISSNTFDIGDVTFTLAEDWKSHWIYDNGYFYYNKAVASGETTEKLLESISISADKWNEYKKSGADLNIMVLADAIQSVGGAVENRWGDDLGLKSNDKPRPAEADTAAAIVSMFSSVDENVSVPDNVVSSSAYVLTDYMKKRIANMVISVNAVTIYEFSEDKDSEDETVEINREGKEPFATDKGSLENNNQE